MKNDNSNSVAVICLCDSLSEKVILNRDKFQRRLRRAIEDMAEDGLYNFILSIDEHSPFAASFIDALIAEKDHNTTIRLTLLIPCEIEEGFVASPAERLRHYTRYADELIYCKRGGDITSLLDKSAAVILYCDSDNPLRLQIMKRLQRDSLPMININI